MLDDCQCQCKSVKWKHVWLVVLKTKKQHEKGRTKHSTTEHLVSRSATGHVRTDVTDIPEQVRPINGSNSSSSSGSRGQQRGHRFHGMVNDIITNDEVTAGSHKESTSERIPSSVTLSFQLKGNAVELHLTRSRSQTSHGKVLVAERGHIRRWIPTSLKDVSRILFTAYYITCVTAFSAKTILRDLHN